jgi:RNase P subunit RPR2
MVKIETPKTFARKLSDGMLTCRAFGHTRDDVRIVADQNGRRVTFTCTRCGAERSADLSRDGFLTGRSRSTRPDGYASPIGRLGRDGNAAMRAEFMRRLS